MSRRGSKHGIDRDEWSLRRIEFAPRGRALPHAKLDDEKVREIRASYVQYSSTRGLQALARRFGIHRRTVEKVLSFETWGHVR